MKKYDIFAETDRERGNCMTSGLEIKKDRELYVVKSNDLIRSRYNLTTQQQKIIIFAISKIKANDKPGQWYEISIDELCAACGLDIDAGGFYYRTIKKDLQALTTRLWITFPDKSEGTVAWISDARIIPLSGTVYIKFHEALEEHLFWLQSRYTQYKLYEVLSFHNKYAIRLYEILRSYIKREELETGEEKEKTFSVKELREMMKIEAYPQWGEFERNVIRKAVEEINKYSDVMRISYDIYKKNKKVETVNFIVTSPKAIESYISRQEARKRLSGSRQSIIAAEVKPQIKRWREQNPKGTRADCIRETGITKYAVYRYWQDVETEEKYKEIEELRTNMAENDNRLKSAKEMQRELEGKTKKLNKMINEDAPKMAYKLADKINNSEGEEKKAAEEELQSFLDDLRTITEGWTRTIKEISRE